MSYVSWPLRGDLIFAPPWRITQAFRVGVVGPDRCGSTFHPALEEVIVHLRDPGRPAAGRSRSDELDEAQRLIETSSPAPGLPLCQDSDGVQQHPAVVGRQVVELLEEDLITQPGVPGTVGGNAQTHR